MIYLDWEGCDDPDMPKTEEGEIIETWPEPPRLGATLKIPIWHTRGSWKAKVFIFNVLPNGAARYCTTEVISREQ